MGYSFFHGDLIRSLHFAFFHRLQVVVDGQKLASLLVPDLVGLSVFMRTTLLALYTLL